MIFFFIILFGGEVAWFFFQTLHDFVSREAAWFLCVYRFRVFSHSLTQIACFFLWGWVVFFAWFLCGEFALQKKCPGTVTKITKEPLGLHSLPGWHMKYIRPGYIFLQNNCPDIRFGLAVRGSIILIKGLVTLFRSWKQAFPLFQIIWNISIVLI